MTQTVGIVGAGAVAHALCAALTRPGAHGALPLNPGEDPPADHFVGRAMVWARRPEAAASVARFGGGRAVVAEAIADLQACDVILVAVSDASIGAVGEQLRAAFLGAGPTPRAVFHTGGARTGEDALAALASTSAALGSLHPLVAVAHEPAPSPELFVGMPFAVEATRPDAIALGRQLIGTTGGFEVELPAASTPGEARLQKMRYHALATLVATGVVTLVDRAAASMVPLDADGSGDLEVRAAFRRAYGELAGSAVRNVLRDRGAAVLTGAMARGDDALVEQHIEALGGAPETDLYRAIEAAARQMLQEDTP